MRSPEFSREAESELKIETLKGPEENEASLCSKRGGIITSIKLRGKEILRQDPNDFKDPNFKVRGGIPIMFPNAGPLKEGGPYPLLKQHGFARSSEWDIDRNGEGGELVEKIEANEDTKKSFPYDFLLRMKIKAEEDGSISLIQEVTNREKVKDMPVSMGLHPYFQVPEENKKEILASLIGEDDADKKFEEWLNGGTISIDNPGDLGLIIPGVGTIRMNVSEEYKKIWIWTQLNQDFICVEPVMRDVEGLTEDPELIEPGENILGRVNFSLE
jgi:galactose mutarotase-like enzyme